MSHKEHMYSMHTLLHTHTLLHPQTGNRIALSQTYWGDISPREG